MSLEEQCGGEFGPTFTAEVSRYVCDYDAYNHSVNWEGSMLNPRRGLIVGDILTVVRSFVMPPLMLSVTESFSKLFSLRDFINGKLSPTFNHVNTDSAIKDLTYDNDAYFAKYGTAWQFNGNNHRFHYAERIDILNTVYDARYLSHNSIAVAAFEGLRVGDRYGYRTVRNVRFKHICTTPGGELFAHTGPHNFTTDCPGGFLYKIDMHGGSDLEMPVAISFVTSPLSPWRDSKILIAHGDISTYDGQVTPLGSSGDYNNVAAYDENYVFVTRDLVNGIFLIDIRMGVSARSVVGYHGRRLGNLLVVKPHD